MPKRNALRDVDPLALTLCKQGANRQRIFLKKSAVAEGDLMTLPAAGHMPLLKAGAGADWTAFYCVVAEPGAEEDPGLVGDADSVDVWENEDEIRKAAHRLLKNAAYVNTVHDGEKVEGAAIVESAIALADLPLEDATIKKGSWYVAIEPTAELRKSIDDGDIEAISLEGSGVRVSLEKAATFAERIGEGQLRDAMWRAWDTLSSVIYDAFNDADEGDPKAVIRTSVDEFRDYLVGELERSPAAGTEGLRKVRGSLRLDEPPAHQEDDMGLADDFAELKTKIEKDSAETAAALKKSDEVNGALVGLVGGLVERVEALATDAGKAKGSAAKADETPDAETAVKKIGEMADKLDEFEAELTGIAKSIRALGKGSSSQHDDDEADKLRKAREEDPLAGLLS